MPKQQQKYERRLRHRFRDGEGEINKKYIPTNGHGRESLSAAGEEAGG